MQIKLSVDLHAGSLIDATKYMLQEGDTGTLLVIYQVSEEPKRIKYFG